MIKIGTKEDFKILSKLDYTNICEKMFSISCVNNVISFSEVSLPDPHINRSEIYIDEITRDMIPKLENDSYIPLIAIYENCPAGYLMAKWEKWPNGKVLSIEGILVANKYSKKGLAKEMLQKIVEIAKQDSKCRGIYAEMDTTKYQANKLLLSFGFKFGGSKLFVYSKEEPRECSKEAVFFYYPVQK